MKGRIHSIQTLGTLDGPGVRFVIFMQGCNLRCSCCHNPDTWECGVGQEYTAEELVKRALKYREYFGEKGGITVSGGEPLLQAEFLSELFSECKRNGLNTCLDSSGCILNENVKKLLKLTDRVLLDIKYTNEADYKSYVGCSMTRVIDFLKYIDYENIPTTIRQVIIPTVNDNEESVMKLNELVKEHKCIDKIELLPFRKICITKYENMGIDFPFANIPEPENDKMEYLNKLLEKERL